MSFKLNFVSYQCSQWHKLRWETLFDISFLICNPLKKNFSMFTQKLTNSNARLVFSPLSKMFWLYMTRFLLNFSQLLGKPLWSGRVLVLYVLGCVHFKVSLYLCLCLVLVSVLVAVLVSAFESVLVPVFISVFASVFVCQMLTNVIVIWVAVNA